MSELLVGLSLSEESDKILAELTGEEGVENIPISISDDVDFGPFVSALANKIGNVDTLNVARANAIQTIDGDKISTVLSTIEEIIEAYNDCVKDEAAT